MRGVSIVVPTLNEEQNVVPLVQRLATSMVRASLPFEVIIVDDHSQDQTRKVIARLSKKYPISLYEKKGKKGKAYSLLEGFSYAKYEIVAMIDADLQYQPEAIPKMILMLSSDTAIVVGRRVHQQIPLIRKITHVGFQFIFARLLHGLDVDVQSGMKVFKKEILQRLTFTSSAWTFDLEFLLKAKNAGYGIAQYDVPFSERKRGQTKVNVFKASYEIGWHAVRTKLRELHVVPFSAKQTQNLGFGFHCKGVPYVTHSKLPGEKSAVVVVTLKQKILLTVAILSVVLGLLVSWRETLIVLFAVITLVYFVDLCFNLLLIIKSLSKNCETAIATKELAKKDSYWPAYTVLCPLYKEWQVLPQFLQAISRIDYPKNKLQVLLLLEEDDLETRGHIDRMLLPPYFTVITVPDGKPKTKPKALNYGLLHAKGRYTVVFDAEDIPEKDQLKKAVMAFAKSAKNVVCVQAKLNYYNPKQNILTRLFTAEYSLWFDLVLVGLQSLHLPIPLGGTSNHFKTAYLRTIHGWDAFNVTEDCDIGLRLSKMGFETAMINSTTYEEANSNIKNWLNQRTRWIKGYMQTYLIHMRDVGALHSKRELLQFATFQLVVGGKICSLFINPLLWVTTFVYFAFRETTAPIIESFIPAPVLYIGVVCLVFGNFLYLYYYMIGCAKRGYYDIIGYAYLIPLYWVCMSIAGCSAFIQLIVKPHYWAKTIHGLHLASQKTFAGIEKDLQAGLASEPMAYYPLATRPPRNKEGA